MTDYFASVHGQFNPELTWSFGTHLTSALQIGDVLSNWANAWGLAWADPTNGLDQFYPVNTQMTHTRVAQLDPTFHETQNQVNNNIIPGKATGDTLPYLNAIVVSQRSGLSKRFNRGRYYLPAVEETFVNNNLVDPAAGAKMKLAVNGVFTALASAGISVFVVSKKPHKDGTGLYTKTAITSWEVGKKPARQSRRVKKQVNSYF